MRANVSRSVAGAALVGLLAAVLLVAAPAAAGPFDLPGYAKALTCAACHGADGNSKSNAMPIIAGLDPAYFTKQIEAYAAGKRLSPEMEPYAKQVLNVGVADVAAYFAAQPRQPTPIKADSAAVARGRAASSQCAACHGPEGKGNKAQLIPSLAGQPPGYLLEQMILFKQDRRNPGDPQLSAIKAFMRTLSDAQLADLAAFYSSAR
jgi:cytochrome c553